MKTLTFNGKCTNEFGIVIQEPPVYDFPEKDYDVQHVPGRTGDIVVDLGSYKNTQRTYNLVNIFTKEGTAIFPWKSGTTPLASDFITRARAMVKWFMDAKGYCELKDDYEPDVYRKAMFYANGNFTNILNQGTAIQATFECKPQRYLEAGKTPITPTHAGQIAEFNNAHSDLNASPVIKIEFDQDPPWTTDGKVKITDMDVGNLFVLEFNSDTAIGCNSITIDWENKTVIGFNNTWGEFNMSSYTTLKYNGQVVDDFPEILKDHSTIEIEVTSASAGAPEIKNTSTIKYNWWFI